MQKFNLETVAQAKTYKDLKVLADIPRFYARQSPDKTALIYEGRQTTYGEQDQYSTQVANGLISEGVSRQKNIAWLDINTDYFFEMVFGCAKSNTVICPINWRLAGPEIVYILNNAEAEMLFVGERFFDLVDSIKDQLVTVKKIIAISGIHSGWESYVSWRDLQSREDPNLNVAVNDVGIQLYTSGTTGNPKGVLLSTGALLASLNDDSQEMAWDKWDPDNEVGLLVMPCFHIAGLRWGTMGAVPGATNVILSEFDPAQVAESIARYKVTRTMLVPAAMQAVLQYLEGSDADCSSLKLMWYGASPIPLEMLKKAIDVFQCDFIQSYGMTETTAQATYLPPPDHTPEGNERMKSAGKPLPNVQVRIEDKEGRILPVGEVGEICINSPANMLGYWKLPEETAKVLKQGWILTGDAGYMDEDGYVYIHDRVKDMVVSGGENIYPAEVESAIFGHPAIADVAVIGVPDERWGEAVKAVVILKEEAQKDDPSAVAKDIIAWARERIAGYKAPKSVDFVDALPRNSSGKLLKKELRAKYWQGKTRMVN